MKNSRFIFLFVASLLMTSCDTNASSFAGKNSNKSSVSATPSICEHHFVLKGENDKEPTIIEAQGTEYVCDKCGISKYQDASYDLNEYVFEDQTYVYDGKEHKAVIKGMIPYGCTVEYENNTLKEKGSKEATAKVYDFDHHLVDVKKANINIIENAGLYNIRVNTSNVEIVSKEDYVDMTLSTDNCPTEYIKNDVAGGIRCRGNGTYTYDKKPYRIKFNSKTNLFGLNKGAKAKSWVLLAEYADQSMLRNMTAFYMGNSLFNYSNNYCSSYLPVNLYLNGEYHGLYVLAEQQQANTNRIKINEAKSGYTGTDIGYLIELDSRANEEEYYFTVGKGSIWGGYGGYGMGSQSGDPLDGTNVTGRDYAIKSDCYSKEQSDYIKKYLTNVYYALYKAVHGDGLYVLNENNDLVASPYKSQYETLNSFIDLESLFKMYLLHEFIKDIDVGFGSFYMWVDFSSTSQYKRLTFGAPWDFDWSSGNVNDSYVASSSGEYNSQARGNYNPWFFMFSKTDFFKRTFKRYYSVFSNSNILEDAIDHANYYASAYKSEYERNYAKWKNLGKIVEKYTPSIARNFKKHQDAVDYFTEWLKSRKKTLDKIFQE